MNKMHELLIGILIVTIVAIQIYVFITTLDKIKFFKNILPNQGNFKTVKVFIKENEIETVSLVHIFKNIEKYKDIEEEKTIEKEFINQNSHKQIVNSINPLISFEEEIDFHEDFEDDSPLYFIEKGGITKMVSWSELSHYEKLGWNKLV